MWCLADLSGPFYETAKPFRNWSSLPYYQLDLPEPPYVDQPQLDRGIERAIRQLHTLKAQGYNGVVIDNLAHLITFQQAPVTIYRPEDREYQRAQIYRAAFARLFAQAAELDMAIFVTSDMQWSTPALQRFAGTLSLTNPQLADANRWALEELFASFPQVQGVVIRFGETGGAHNVGDYAGHMLYRSVAGLRWLIDQLLPVCEQRNRLLIVRTWSIGIGELGDLIWSKTRYQAVFGGYGSPQLLVSIKHGPTDFFRRLPANPTIGQPGPQQIIEFQNRREYELFGMVPSSIAQLHANALRHAMASDRYAGLWAWNATGGWGGGSAALGPDGWNCWTELSSALTAALAHNPALERAAFVQHWFQERFPQSPQFALTAAQLYLESGWLIKHGWYIRRHDKRARLAGMRIPPLLWVWWMRPTASALIWAYFAATVTDQERILRKGMVALIQAQVYARQLAEQAPADDATAAFIAESAQYLADVLLVAQAIWRMLLPAFAAAQRGDLMGWRVALQQRAGLAETLAQHRKRWQTRSDFPALELGEFDQLLRQLQRAPRASWQQARLACLVVTQLRSGRKFQQPRYLSSAAFAALLGMLLFRRRPASAAGVASILAPWILAPQLRRQAIKSTLPWLNRQFPLLPSIFFETGPALSEWTAGNK